MEDQREVTYYADVGELSKAPGAKQKRSRCAGIVCSGDDGRKCSRGGIKLETSHGAPSHEKELRPREEAELGPG
jgi:hypothetical protein